MLTGRHRSVAGYLPLKEPPRLKTMPEGRGWDGVTHLLEEERDRDPGTARSPGFGTPKQSSDTGWCGGEELLLIHVNGC